MYMFSGESVLVKIETTEEMMSELVDWFGNDFRVKKLENGKINAQVICNVNAMRYWALQYGPFVEVLEPDSLRNTIKEDIKNMSKKYNH